MKKFLEKVWDKVKTYTWALRFKLGYNFNPLPGFPYKAGLWAHAALFFDDVDKIIIYRYAFSTHSEINLDETDFNVYKYTDVLPENYDIYENAPILLATLMLKQYEQGLGINSLLGGNKIRLYTNSSKVAGEFRNRLSTFGGSYACNPYFFHYMGMNSHDQHGIPYNFNHSNGNLFITYLPEG